MPRLFTAIKVPDQAAQFLALKKGKLNNARWIDQEDYHITLSFLGDISDLEAEKAADKLEEIRHKPFEICIDCMDVFGSKRPRTLFAGVRCDEALVNLQAKHNRAMTQVGLKLQARKYAPHVTLARLSSVKPGDVPHFMGQSGEFRPLVFAVNGYALFSARNSTGGGPYLVEQEFDF
ncbi:MAG: RNA 2',3'-cyclic phosphodiesterase [Hyphomicrobiales bacterium]|nr:RNA 2',3'-cyclic phosphodiesterase [Hyphomicrobiales bacterium]